MTRLTGGRLTLARALALSLCLSLVQHVRMILVAIGPALGTISGPLVVAVAWTWIALMAVTIIGLARGRRWGAFALALLAPVSTMLVSIPLVPLITKLVPHPYRPQAMVLVNIAVLAAVPILLRKDQSRDPRVP